MAAWALVAVYLYFAVFHPKWPFGLFLLPLALALIGAARFLADAAPLGREPASRIWGAIHGLSIVLATVAVLVGFVAGLMYLGQVRHLKHKIVSTRGLRLPSLEWLQWANFRAIVVSVLMLGVGILSGLVLNHINARQPSPAAGLERSGGAEHLADVLLAAGGGGSRRVVPARPARPQGGLPHPGELRLPGDHAGRRPADAEPALGKGEGEGGRGKDEHNTKDEGSEADPSDSASIDFVPLPPSPFPSPPSGDRPC